MKRIGFIILAVFIIFTGCYDGNETAKVRINLGNLPIAHNVPKKSLIDKILCLFSKEAYAEHPSYINRVHLIAVQNNNITAVSTIDISDIVENPENIYNETAVFEVPAGNNISIVVLGEVKYAAQEEIVNYISYHGKTDSAIDLKAGEEKTVQIAMANLDGSLMQFNFLDEGLAWNILPGATKYNIYDESGNLILSTTGTFYNGYNSYTMKIDFDYINQSSDQLSIQIP